MIDYKIEYFEMSGNWVDVLFGPLNKMTKGWYDWKKKGGVWESGEMKLFAKE